MRSFILLFTLIFGLLACESTPPAETSETPKEEAVKAEKETAKEEAKAEVKKEEVKKPVEESPQRKSLQLLAARGGAEARSLREERSGLYQLFRNLDKKQRKALGPLIDKVQMFQWDNRPEKIQEGPKKILALIGELTAAGAEYKNTGEASHEKLAQWEKEHTTGKRRHKEAKMEKQKAKKNSELKAYHYTALLTRSLINEAQLYARFGSWAMQEELKEAFVAMKTTLPRTNEVQKAYRSLLSQLGVKEEKEETASE